MNRRSASDLRPLARLMALVSVPTLALALLFVGCAQSGTSDGDVDPVVAQLFEPIPPAAPVPEDNALTEAGIDRGQMPFFEQKLTRWGGISCNASDVVWGRGCVHLPR